ncbi:L-lactate dehydrogenase (cytochrome) [Malassezia cuniculi]|uniref:L-lactate dehydrogenase (cytochrome) n=1 Tax=Malassezia cuniculi TaxID=948313 RepID=A0AAF0J674_9BASI|nr:L-lactate dehydrogenase (cytochrome) [Malassezia cuniculi]
MKISYQEVSKHNTREDCYVILYNKVYDMSEFIPHHPGGPQIIVKYAGKDATAVFDPVHAPGTIEKHLPKEKFIGELDLDTVPQEVRDAANAAQKEEEDRRKNIPPLSGCLNLFDLELVGSRVLSNMAWAYYSSAADDMATYNENRDVFRRIWFRPRILRNVKNIDLSTRILGHHTTLPIYITATALGRLGHPDGEMNLTKAAAREGITQMVPTLASCSAEEIAGARDENGAPTQFFQLYVNSDRRVAEEMIHNAEKLGFKGIFVTVDAPQLGRRERDMRTHFEDSGSDVQKKSGEDVQRDEGAARAISSFIDPSLDWNDIVWMKSVTRLPIILKGVQCWEDAVMAAEFGLAGVVLSNHGGRQLDFARSSVEILAETVDALKERGLFPRPGFEIFVDGGFRRGTDVLKAIAMGATAVGIGRPFLYAYSAYGPDGVVHALRLLRAEMEMNMRLIGAPTLKDLVPEMVDLKALHHRGSGAPTSDDTTVFNPKGSKI